MTHNQIHEFLSACLSTSADHIDLQDSLANADTDWESVFATVGDALVTPGLYVSLKKKGLLDIPEEEAVSYLEQIHALNLERNQRILDEFCQISLKLNEVGIVPVPLKGTALLLDGTYSDSGERILKDIDLMVDKSELPLAVEVLLAAGYLQEKNEYPIPGLEDFRNHEDFVVAHVPIFFKSYTVATIELHISPTKVHDSTHHMLVDNIQQKGAEQQYNNARYLLPNAQTNLLINIWHSQIKDANASRGILDMRHLKDFSLLTAPCDNKALRQVTAAAREADIEHWFFLSYLQSKSFYRQPDVEIEIPLMVRLHYRWFQIKNRSAVLLKIAHAKNECRHYIQRFFSVHTLRAQFGPRPLLVAYALRTKRIIRFQSIKRNIKMILNIQDDPDA